MREAKGITVSYGPVTKNYAKGLTNRRCLLIFGALLTVAGIAGFFLGTSPGDLYHMDLGQSIAYLALGMAALYVGEVWNSEYKRIFLGLEGLFFLVAGVAGFILSAVVSGAESINLGIFTVQHLWENAAHLALGVIFLGTALYPRRFRDYSYSSNASD
jgi:hypothetical protein